MTICVVCILWFASMIEIMDVSSFESGVICSQLSMARNFGLIEDFNDESTLGVQIRMSILPEESLSSDDSLKSVYSVRS